MMVERRLLLEQFKSDFTQKDLQNLPFFVLHCAPATAHNIATSKMAAVLLARKEQTRAAFAELKLLLAITMP